MTAPSKIRKRLKNLFYTLNGVGRYRNGGSESLYIPTPVMLKPTG